MADEGAMRILLAACLAALAFATAAPGATLHADARLDAPAVPPADLPSLDTAPASPAGAPPLPELALPPLGPALDVAPLALPATQARRDPLVPDAWADALARVPPAAPASLAAAGGLAVLVAVFYTRLARSELLDNAHRDALFDLVKAEPGIALTEVAQRLGLGWGATNYHVDRLERAGFVASERDGLRRCLFPVGALPRERRRRIGALRAHGARQMAALLMERPGATQGELAEALGWSASVASKHVTKLEQAGLARRERQWKSVRVHPTPGLVELMPSRDGAIAAQCARTIPA